MNDLKDFCGWSFFVDTGGTFTDCLGLSPNREWFRAKVLSRGSIPAEVLEQIDAKTLKISKTENLPKHFVNGFTVHISGLNHFFPQKYLIGTRQRMNSPWRIPYLQESIFLQRSNWYPGGRLPYLVCV